MQGQADTSGRVPYTYKGKTFLIPKWSTQIEADFAKWVETRARQQAWDRRKEMSQADYETEMARINKEKNAGEFEWGADVVMRAWGRWGPVASEGNKLLVYMTLHALDESITQQWVEDFSRDRKEYMKFWNTILWPLNYPPDEPDELQKGETRPAQES